MEGNTPCPICGRSFPPDFINEHVNMCLDNQNIDLDIGNTQNTTNDTPNARRTSRRASSLHINTNSNDNNNDFTLFGDIFSNQNNDIPTPPDLNTFEPPVPPEPQKIQSPPIQDYLINTEVEESYDEHLKALDPDHLLHIIQEQLTTGPVAKDVSKPVEDKKQYPIIELPVVLKKPVDPLVYLSDNTPAKNENTTNDIPITRHCADTFSLFKEIYEKDEYFFDVVISFKNKENSQPNIIKAHSFVLASRSPLFYVELKEMKRIEGVYFYEVENYSYKDFEMFIRVLYSIEPVEKMESTATLSAIASTYSITKGDIMNDIINLQQESFFGGFFCITKNEEEVERLGFSKLLFYLCSDYFFTLFQKNKNTQSRDVTLFPDLGIPKEKYTPKSDTTPFFFKIKGDNEEVGFIKTAVLEFIQFIYKQWKYSLDVSFWNEVSCQKVLPILLHFSYIFKEPTLSVICERLLGQNLIITPKNSNALFLSMNISSDRFKYYLVTNLLDSLKEYSDFNVIREWKKEIVEIIYNITQNLTGYDVVKQITATTGGVEYPLQINCLSINDIQQISCIALISFLNTTSEQSEIVRECCIRKFNTLLSRSDVINFLIVKGLRELLPILLACVGGTSFDSPISKQLNDIMNSLLITICHSYSTLSPLRGFIPLTDNLINYVNRLLESSFTTTKSCSFHFTIMNEQHNTEYITKQLNGLDENSLNEWNKADEELTKIFSKKHFE
ncbi:BTB domain-containing protein [Entamoeba marina]